MARIIDTLWAPGLRLPSEVRHNKSKPRGDDDKGSDIGMLNPKRDSVHEATQPSSSVVDADRQGGAPQGDVPRRLLIIGDIRLYREGLARALESSRGISVVGLAAGLEEALAAVRTSMPDTVLIDMAMVESESTVRRILSVRQDVVVVALAVPERVDSVIACAEAGVSAYVPRNGSIDDLIATIEHAVSGEAICSPQIAGGIFRRLAARAAEHPSRAAETPGLTAREKEILRLLHDGLSNKQIAQRLFIELSTVKNHVHNVLEKLEACSRGEAVARARSLGLCELGGVTSSPSDGSRPRRYSTFGAL